jgi:hypothetical protein
MLAIDIASTYTVSITPGKISYKVCWLMTPDLCVADSPENLLPLLLRLIIMMHTMTVI